ncbi:MAG: DEAD/DEAH box helicase family protein [Bacteroidales bacterium]|nr:DEAD/DEAH box helicase family protein [Bacteroidales bacterium]
MSSQFLTNYTEVSFLERIKANLRSCKSFYFSVSFIKKAGLVLLANDIVAAIERGAVGKLITTTYQNFTDIESLKFFLTLSSHSNFECHLDFNCFYDERNYSKFGFHSKGYMFEFDNEWEIVIGSSNITRYALLKNIEWDMAVKVPNYDIIITKTKEEFENLWERTKPLNITLINDYSKQLNFAIERWDMDYDLTGYEIKPNFMQRKALRELNRYRAMGQNKALVVAATGSGKTYLAAFDALNFNPEKLLYIVHESSILKRSLSTFQNVFGPDVFMGEYNGEHKDIDAQFLFSTNVSMCKSLYLFAKKEFDYIIIDECHHAAAESYKKIIDYFEPEFLLGLTATPERMDNQDVFELFGNNVPYELRLRDALINDLIVPFKYYGIRDEQVDFSKENERRMISQFATDEHCKFIVENIKTHRVPNQKLKALAFCKSISHARLMAEALEPYYKTAYLTGKNDAGERIRAFEDLQSDKEGTLEVLCAVDILNEGVDIPGVNMVLFMRPTESSTIFIQQLGRGLRKYDNKSYVPVIDFIGNNYKRSTQIALALGGLAQEFILEKRLLCALIKDDFKPIGLFEYGVEIHIDNLSKEEILNYVEKENFYSLKYLKQDYNNFKNYLNSDTYPKHMDYLNSDNAPDLLKFMQIKINQKKTGSYYGFLKGINEENIVEFDEEQLLVVNYLSSLLHLVRPHDYMICQQLLLGENSIKNINENLKSEIANYNVEEFNHALKYLQENEVITIKDDYVTIAGKQTSVYKEYLADLLEYGLTKYKIDYEDSTDMFLLWKDYRYDQVQIKRCVNPNYTAVGTYYDDSENVVYIFASIKKDEVEGKEYLNYKDKFIEPSVFQWECMANISDKHLNALNDSKYAHLFIRKMDSENGITLPFTYVGKGHLQNPRRSQNKDDKRTFIFDIHMENELPDYLQYDFGLTKGII